MDAYVILLSLLVAFLWALNTVVYKYCMNQSIDQKTVSVIGAFTYFICMFFFAIYYYDDLCKDIQKTNPNHILMIVIASIIGTFIATILFTYLLQKHNSSVVTTIAYTSPIFVLILALLLLNEKFDYVKLLGIFITIIGISIVSM